MDTLTFLDTVLPKEGVYALAVLTPGKPVSQGFFQTTKQLASSVTALVDRGEAVSYAVSSYKTKGSRKSDNAHATRVFVLDVDCGEKHPYPSWREGLVALGEFVASLELPRPMVVHSGNGLHAYWVLDTELAPIVWLPLAEALKTAAQDQGFSVDPGVTADIARVLRPVGAVNPKNGATVKLLMAAPTTTIEAMMSSLQRYIAVAAPETTIKPQTDREYPPAKDHLIRSKCAQVAWGVDNQDKASEPFWYRMMGVAVYCESPEDVAISWSKDYPGYDKRQTLAKVANWKQAVTGPTRCKSFRELRPSGCKDCIYKDKIGTPVSIGIQYASAPPADKAPAEAATDLPMPSGFKRTDNGVVLTIDGTDIDVAPFDIYPVSYGKDESLGYEVVRYCWERKHVGWQELVLRQANLTTTRSREFTTDIADQGIVLMSEKQTGFFQMLLRSYMDGLRRKQAMTNLYATMGWKEDYSKFVIGDLVLRRNADGTVSEETTTLASTSKRLGGELWQTAGTLQGWTDFTALMERTNLFPHMFALGVSLSSPLYAFTGLHGLTISLYGPTGGGKTLAQYWQQSIWGNPEKLHFSAKFTQNSLFSRMGLYCHLPVTIDEATTISDKDVGDFLYWVSQGRDKARLNRNAEEREARVWAAPTTISTNRSWQSKLVTSGLDTDAQAARLLELSVPVHPMFAKASEAGRRVYGFLHSNYGHVGREFLRRLLELSPTGIRAAIEEATTTFHSRYKCTFSGIERYWEQALILSDLSLQLAAQWGLIKFDPVKGTEWALSQLGAIRRNVSEGCMDAFDILAEYLSEFADTQVQVFHTDTQKPSVDHNRLPRGGVRIRFDFYRKAAMAPITHGTLMLDRTHFRKWLATRGSDYKTLIQEFTEENVIATPKSNKAYLAKDTPIKMGQVYTVGVNLNHPRLIGILTDADQAIEDMAYGELKLVKP
jgi:hypothetical protein